MNEDNPNLIRVVVETDGYNRTAVSKFKDTTTMISVTGLHMSIALHYTLVEMKAIHDAIGRVIEYADTE